MLCVGCPTEMFHTIADADRNNGILLVDLLNEPQGAIFEARHMEMILETDQRFCIDERGNRVTCRNAKQDASLERNAYPTKRFEVSNETVEDTWTGLSWFKNANLPGFPLTWNESKEFVREINRSETAALKKWRLPSRTELFSLVSHQQINPSLPEAHPFENVFNGYYWTQTECARLSNQAWYIHLGGGRVQRGMKHGSYMVWPVAGPKMEIKHTDNRFEKNGNFIFDTITKKIWLSVKEISQGTVNWREANRFIDSINCDKRAGFADWRLPKIRELESLIEPSRHSPAFAENFLLDSVQDGYWSSTTSIYEANYAWVLYTRDGAIGVGYKPKADFFLLPVRG
jgi:hypothetical protein